MDLLNSSAPRRWVLRPEPTTAPSGDFPPLIGRLLAYRGVRTAEEARRFLEGDAGALTDPYRLPGMGRAVGRLWIT